MDVAIEASHVSKVFKLYSKPIDRLKEALNPAGKKYHADFYALNDVSFQIQKGEAVGIVGKNGSGKSTLLKLLTRVQTPTHGAINVNGKVSALLELGAGFNSEYTGEENIYLNGQIMGYSRKQMAERADEIIKFADIGDFIFQPVKTYSSGMFVRLAFAVAINVDPDILIVDEALSVGDTRFQLKCIDKIAEFIEAKKTVLFVSHDVNSIKRFCKRAIWLNEGKMMQDGNVNRVTDNYLDYMKAIGTVENISLSGNADNIQVSGMNMTKIDSLNIYNSTGEKLEDIAHGELITVEVAYSVNDTSVQFPVLGVALYSLDHKYICGLNTLLDKKKIPWNKGLNKVKLKYKNFCLTGGSYYFDVAIFDKTATVDLDYKKSFRTFFVSMNYIAEGMVVLEHEWEV